MIDRIAFAALLAAATLAPTAPLAQSAAPVISREEALDIARKEGMTRLEEIELDDGRWEIEGDQANGREIELDIDATSGLIVKLELD